MIKEFFIWLGIGVAFLVLQATWFYGEEINPFRLDLVFILVTLLGTLGQFGLGILVSAFLGMLVDILSWDMLGLTLIALSFDFFIVPPGLDPDPSAIPVDTIRFHFRAPGPLRFPGSDPVTNKYRG